MTCGFFDFRAAGLNVVKLVNLLILLLNFTLSLCLYLLRERGATLYYVYCVNK